MYLINGKGSLIRLIAGSFVIGGSLSYRSRKLPLQVY